MSAHWLMKSEPVKYGWDDLVRDGETLWDGVRNNQAALYLKAMQIGDQAFFYHSNEGLAVVGVMAISALAATDPGDPAGRFVAVRVKPLHPLPRPVTLGAMKAEPRLKDMAMFRQFRLSVAPVSEAEWRVIMAMGEV